MSVKGKAEGLQRREFLRVMGVGAVGAAAAAPLLASGAAEAAETPEERVKQRYRETDHVKKFYETNRF